MDVPNSYFTELARFISIIFQLYLISKLLGTSYFVLGTIKVRNTGLKISNAERRILNEEEKTSDYKNTILCTSYNILDTSYLILNTYAQTLPHPKIRRRMAATIGSFVLPSPA